MDSSRDDTVVEEVDTSKDLKVWTKEQGTFSVKADSVQSNPNFVKFSLKGEVVALVNLSEFVFYTLAD